MSNTLQILRFAAIAGLMLPLGGCVRLQSPEKPDPGAAALRDSWIGQSQAGPVADGWLASFGDPQLTALVTEALTNNNDLAATAARLDQSMASAKIAGASLWPSLNLGANAQNSTRLDRSASQKQAGVKANSSSFGASLDLSWELDLWGRLRYSHRGAEETAAASAADYVAARHSLAAQVAKSWFAAIEAQLQLRLDEEFVKTYEQTLRLVEFRFKAGSIAEQDLANAKADVASAKRLAEAAATSLKEALRSLEVLLGRYPAAEVQLAGDLQAVPPPVPAGLPSDLLERRPDVIAAERRLAAAFNNTQQAKAARLPSVSLTSSLGSSSTELKDLVDPKNAALNFAGNLTAPLFDAGSRKTQVELARAQQREAAANYRGVALNAFQEVENYLVSGESFARQEEFLKEAAKQYETARLIGEKRYSAGDIDLVDLLLIQRQELQSKSNLLSTRAQCLAARVNLHLALGGDFTEAKPDEP